MSLKLLRMVKWGRSKWFEATIDHDGRKAWSRDPVGALEMARGAEAAHGLMARIAERRGRDPNAPRVVGASVSAEEFDACVGSALEAEILPLGYTLARRRVWWRDAGNGIHHVISIAAWKGATYTIKFGVALDFVPHIDGRGNIAWHRTAKSVFAEHSILTSISWMGLTVIQPLESFEKDVAFIVPRAVRMSEIYLADVVDDETALAFLDRADRQFGPNRRRVSIDYGQVDLARTFLEARLGKTDEAMARLEAWCETQRTLRDLEPRSAERLRKLIAGSGTSTMS